MTRCRSSSPGLAILLLTAAMTAGAPAAALLDDRAITIDSTQDIVSKRRALIQYLWGKEGFPFRRQPDVVQTNISSNPPPSV